MELVGKIVKVDGNEIGKVIALHTKGLHYDENLKHDQYYLVKVKIGVNYSSLYFTRDEILDVYNF